MRVVVGSGGGTGGSDTFQTTFGSSRTTESKSLPVSGSVSGTVGGHTLSTPELASHQHVITKVTPNPQNPSPTRGFDSGSFLNRRAEPTSLSFEPSASFNTAGGGGSHSHPFSGTLTSSTTGSSSFAIPGMDLKHANVIIAAKD